MQTSVPLRNAIKNILFTKSCVHLRKFIILSTVAALAVLAVSLPQHQMAKFVMRVKKKELGAWRKNGREDGEVKCSHNPVKSASRMMSTKESSSA